MRPSTPYLGEGRNTVVTRPSIVCSVASASTRRPRARAASEVIGPIDTTVGCGSGSVPTRSQKPVTVDDDVNVIASTSPSRTASSIDSSGSARTVRYTGSTSTE